MNEDRIARLEQMLEAVLTELRRLNAREEERDGRAVASQHRFDNLV